MSSIGGPKIITNGLVLYLDAANYKSYPTSGTTWTDLSNSVNNGTLENSPTFNSLNGGSFVFTDVGTERIKIIPTNLPITNLFSISSWVRCTNVASSNNIVSRNGPYFMRIDSSKVRFNVLTSSGWLFQNGTTNLQNNLWYNLCMTYDGILFKGYINGVQEFSVSKTGNTSASGAYLYIGYTPDVGEQAAFNGNISVVKIYNTALNNSEILQNYNASKSRFGL